MKKIFAAILILSCIFSTVFMPMCRPVMAQTAAEIKQKACDNNPNAVGCNNSSNLTDIVSIIVDTLLFALAGTCVVVIIIGGVRFSMSGGNSTGVTNAKNSILYGVVGLVVAFAAYAIVHFVIGRFS